MLKKIQKLGKSWNYSKREKFQKIKKMINLAMCENCYAFYYKNSWHLKRPEYLSEYSDEEIPIFFTQCPSCLEQEEAMYEKESDLAFG